MAGSAAQRQCFTCHNQAVPVFALAEARRRGFDIDQELFERQLTHTAKHLRRGKEQYLAGRGQGGKALMAGYALWTLEAGGWQGDEVTEAVSGFLLDYQQDAGRWSHPGTRPPSSGSDFTTTYVALRGLEAFATESQQEPFERRKQAIATWLAEKDAPETEDRVFRLRALSYADISPEVVSGAAEELAEAQLECGGWSQRTDMPADAYATSTVLVALLRSGRFDAESPVVRRGVAYLLGSQLQDGTWHVASRAKPFQTYYETGFPHGKDQFISITASGWSTLALLLSLPESP